MTVIFFVVRHPYVGPRQTNNEGPLHRQRVFSRPKKLQRFLSMHRREDGGTTLSARSALEPKGSHVRLAA